MTMKCLGITKQFIKMQKGKLIVYDVCVRRDSYTVGNEREYNHDEFYGEYDKIDTYTHYAKIRNEFLAKLK